MSDTNENQNVVVVGDFEEGQITGENITVTSETLNGSTISGTNVTICGTEKIIDDTSTSKTKVWSADKVNSSLANYHIGMIIAFAGSTAPNGWFICDGREVSRTEYSRLFTLIGVTYGNGNGTTTFNIPDLRECVLVGSGESTRSAIATHDVYNVGEFKDDQFQGHFHWLTGSGTYETGSDGVGGMKRTYSGARKENGMGLPQGYGEDTYLNLGEPRYGSTTHSKQLGVNYIIKY